jgi:hypothetical protein
MTKQILLDSITKEMKIIRRLATKIPAEAIEFRPKEGIRSTLELLQYLSLCGTSMIRFWYNDDGSDFRTYYTKMNEETKTVTAENFVSRMDAQIELVEKLFEKITEEELFTKEVIMPAGEKLVLGEGIIVTSIKWLTAYKAQLFLYIKLNSDEKLATPDLWRKIELEE